MRYILTTVFTTLLFSITTFGQTVKIGDTSYGTITEAIAAAKGGDVIDITGIHTESITVNKNITLRGTNPVTDIIQSALDLASATRRTITVIGSGDLVTLENLTVRYGNADNAVGGGVYIENATNLVTLSNLVVANNKATKNGGGIGATGSNVLIQDCTIQNNTSNQSGGGIILTPKNNSGQDATVNIKNTLIANNTASASGGGLVVDGNKDYGDDYKLTVNVENTTLTFNSAANEAGAIQVKGVVHTNGTETNISFKMNQSTVAYNNVTGSGSRKGLYFIGSTVTARPVVNLYNSIIALNALDGGKDINFGGSATANVVNCIFGSVTNKNATFVANESGLLLNQTNTELLLSTVLVDTGGKTEVLTIDENSVAVGFADTNTALNTDALGATRDNPDTGAYEYQIPKDNVYIGDTRYNTLTEALDAAVNGDVVKIAGTHTASITVNKNITLRGTDPANDIIQAAEDVNSASSRVVAIVGSGDNVTIENLTIRNGNSGDNAGAGIYMDRATGLVTLNNVVVTGNKSNKQGGGISSTGSNLLINNSSITNNTAGTTGGGIQLYPKNGANMDVMATIKNTLIANNTSTGNGAGISMDGSQGYGNDYILTTKLENTTIAFNNSGAEGGAIYAKGVLHTDGDKTNVRLDINHATIAYNSATGSRKAIGFYGAGEIERPAFNIYNSIVALNATDTEKDINFGSSKTGDVVNCIFGPVINLAANATNVVGTSTAKKEGFIKLASALTTENNIQVLVLEEGSGAIGFADAATALTTDATGKTRNNADAGAYEFVSADGDNIWNGANWSKGTLSDSDDVVISSDFTNAGFTCNNLTVEAGQTLEIGNGTLNIKGNFTNNGTVLIKSGASLLTYEGTTFSGNNVTIERNTRYSNGQYSFVGSVVKRNDAIKGKSLGRAIYKYDETVAYGLNDGLERWVKASKDVLEPGKGYTQAYKMGLTFEGEPNTGDVTYTGTYTNTGDTGTDGWNLVANPYVAGIDIHDFLVHNSNIDGSVYLWDDNGSDKQRGSNEDYIVINLVGSNKGSRKGSEGRLREDGGKPVLGAGQGFFVRIKDAGAAKDITFTEDMRKAGFNDDGNFFREAVSTKQTFSLAIESIDKELYASTLIGFLDGATTGEDRLYDAKQFTVNAFQLYSMIGNTHYAIQGLPFVSGEQMIPLGMDVTEAGTYTIDISEIENISENSVIELIDTKLNIIHNLSENGAYTFDTDETLEDTRFVLNVRDAVISSLDAVSKSLEIKANINGLQLFGSNTYRIHIMDMTGKMLFNKQLKNTAQVAYKFEQNKLYLVNVNGMVKKVIFKR